MSERVRRVADEIQREIATLLATGKIKDPRIGFVTITGVEITTDLKEAKVYYVVHGSPEEVKESSRALSDQAPRLRSHLGKVMRIRHAPELRFVHDKSIDEGAKIDALLQEVRRKEGW